MQLFFHLDYLLVTTFNPFQHFFRSRKLYTIVIHREARSFKKNKKHKLVWTQITQILSYAESILIQ